MTNKDPMQLDLIAARDDRARVFFDHGRTEAIAAKRGGRFAVTARLRQLKRIQDVLRECEALDKPIPPNCRVFLRINVVVCRKV